MKTLYSIILLMLVSILGYGQAPEAFNYQALIRNGSGDILAKAPVAVRISILQGSESGSPIYVETFKQTTTEYGLITLQLGKGNVQSGIFNDIDWGTHSYYVEIEVDPNNGTAYTSMGASQLLSVPYALYAKSGGGDDADADPGNEIQNLSISGNNLSISDGNTVTLPPPADNSITSTMILDGEVLAADIATDAVGSSEIAADAVGSGEIATDAIGADEIAAGAVGSSEIAADAVGSGEIATDAVGADEIAADAVGSGEIEDNSVSTTDILNNTIRDADIYSSAGINISKILGAAGIAWKESTGPVTWNAADIAVKQCVSIRMSIPTDGYVFLIHTGYIQTTRDDRMMRLGIGESSTAMVRFVLTGNADVSAVRGNVHCYSVTAVVEVDGGTSPNFYGLGQGHTIGMSAGSVYIYNSMLVGIFIPRDYTWKFGPIPWPPVPK